MKKILIIDDDRDIRMLLTKFLTKKGYAVSDAGDKKRALEAVNGNLPDLMITDYKLPDGDGLQLSKEIIEKYPALPIIMITAYSDVKMAVTAVKRGIFDYITKPLHPDELLETIERALESKESETSKVPTQVARKKAGSAAPSPEYIVGNSSASKKVMKEIGLVAPTDITVMILGETGTGKEYAAREIHAQSKRANAPFVAIDCGALSEEIAGSELFGHVKGAFTGAHDDKTGSFEYAQGGTIFLDEIGNLSMKHQVKLLRVLQESSVKKIGSNKDIHLDVRVVVATNEDVQSGISEGGFRQDLYFRLNEFSLRLPALRERKEDIPLFIDHFLAQANESLGREVTKVDDKAYRFLSDYPWAGNLRELRNVIKRGVLLSTSDTLQADALPPEIVMPSSYFLKQSVGENDLKSASLHAEQEMIMDALRKTGNNKSKAADMLNIDRKTLYNKLKQFEIDH